MTADENPQTTIQDGPQAPDDDRPKCAGGRRTSSTPAATNASSGKKTRYRIYLTAGSLEALHGQPMVRGKDDPLDKLPESTGEDDLLYLAALEGVDRDAAVEALLDGTDVVSDRVTAVRAAHLAHVDLDFKVLPESYLGLVPVPWHVEPTRTIGGR